ncbi:DUF397 domain-containing protein [Micromonospora arborensis]|uniref:DUF397 domain-containing protein n=1 Tax=Micromonospora arborensis TaxID=2116518 RepID=UPI00372048AD
MSTSSSTPEWMRRSSRCTDDHCVIVAKYADAIEVSDSASDGAPLEFPYTSWQTFMASIRRQSPR